MSATDSPLEASAAAAPGRTTFVLPTEMLRMLGAKMPEGVTVMIAAPEDLAPVFIRLPKPDEKCPVSGLPRSSLVDLIQSSGGQVKCHKLKKRGQVNGGQVLIDRQSLINFIHEQPAPEWAETEEGES